METPVTGRRVDAPPSPAQAGRQIRAKRREQHLSPEQLGSLIGVSGRTIRRIENGEIHAPHIRVMGALADWIEKPMWKLWRL